MSDNLQRPSRKSKFADKQPREERRSKSPATEKYRGFRSRSRSGEAQRRPGDWRKRDRQPSSEQSDSAGSAEEESSSDNDENQKKTDAYRLYQKQRAEKRKIREQKAQQRLEMQAKNKLDIRKVTMKDFPNHKKKLVIQNIPLDATEAEIDSFFFAILAQTSNENYS